eukprot:m51a1_g13921 hypothetical protein (503) ;mRNA; f:815184-817066
MALNFSLISMTVMRPGAEAVLAPLPPGAEALAEAVAEWDALVMTDGDGAATAVRVAVECPAMALGGAGGSAAWSKLFPEPFWARITLDVGLPLGEVTCPSGHQLWTDRESQSVVSVSHKSQGPDGRALVVDFALDLSPPLPSLPPDDVSPPPVPAPAPVPSPPHPAEGAAHWESKPRAGTTGSSGSSSSKVLIGHRQEPAHAAAPGPAPARAAALLGVFNPPPPRACGSPRADEAKRSRSPMSALGSVFKRNKEPRHVDLCKRHASDLEAEFVPMEGKELKDFQRSFRQYQLGYHEDYSEKRIKAGKKPMMFEARAVWLVRNATLNEWYDRRLKYMKEHLRRSEDEGELDERSAFVGLPEGAIEALCSTGLLRTGHPLLANKHAEQRGGAIGDPSQGVYVWRYLEFALGHSNLQQDDSGELRPAPVAEGQNVKVVLFKVLPGRSLEVAKHAQGMQPTPGYDSHGSWSQWFLFDETQAVPTHVIAVEAVENTQTVANDGLKPR